MGIGSIKGFKVTSGAILPCLILMLTSACAPMAGVSLESSSSPSVDSQPGSNSNSSASASIVIGGNPSQGPYSVEAKSDLAVDIMVEFYDNGSLIATEHDAPYCLTAENESGCGPGTLGHGSHHLAIKVLAEGSTTLLAEASLELIEGDSSSGGSEPTPTPPPVQTPPSTATPSGPQLFVAPNGSDSNPGTEAAPYRTIQKGINSAKPGYTVRVAAGSYPEQIYSKVSGTANARIRIVSDVKYGAKIKPSGISGVIWENSGSYVDIEGFEIDGSNNTSGIRIGIYAHGSNVIVRGNYVHHIHSGGSCTSQGAAAILGEGYYGDENQHIIGNLVTDAGPSGCNFDHGIYHTGSGNIQNNVVYRASCAGIHLWHDPRYNIVSNNTISDSGVGIILGGGDSYGTTSTPGDYITIANNIIYRTQMAVWGGTMGSHNKFINNLLFDNSKDFAIEKGTPVGTIKADPQFVGYKAGGGGDYRIKTTSPAVNKSDAGSAPQTDFDGFTRTMPDLGAYESH